MHTAREGQSCDFVVKKKGHVDINIECKNHESNIPKKDVDAFLKVITMRNNHGVFVSLKSSIFHKNPIDMELVPGTNKFAFYVSGSEHLVDVIRMIHRLDSITRAISDDLKMDDNSLTITSESASKVRGHVEHLLQKKMELSVHLNQCVKLVEEMTYDAIKNALSFEPEKTRHFCPACHKEFQGLKWLENHMVKCTEKPLKRKKDALDVIFDSN